MGVTVKKIPGPGQKRLQALINDLGEREGMVGWFDSSKYEDGTPVAYIAAIQELGSPANKIPPRPFMRTTAAEQKKAWAKTFNDGSKALLNGTATGEKVMEGLVLQARGDIQAKIASIQEPKLSDITLGLRKYKLGRIPGMPAGPVTGKTVGIIAAKLKDGSLNTSGVSTKPLIEPTGIPGGGTLYTSIDARVE